MVAPHAVMRHDLVAARLEQREDLLVRHRRRNARARLRGAAAGGFSPLPDLACSTSRAMMRPCGPEPLMRAKLDAGFLGETPRERRRENAGVADCPAARTGADAGACGAGLAGRRILRRCFGRRLLGFRFRLRPWLGLRVRFGFGLGAVADAAPAAFTSSPSPAITAITSLTGTSWVPSGTRIFAMVPSSTASTSIVALSVSISAITSPDLTLSPSFLSHLARLPFSIVGDSAGIRMLIGIVSDLVATAALVVPMSVGRAISASNMSTMRASASSSL